MIRMSPQLHDKARKLAVAQGISLNRFCCQQLERSMQAEATGMNSQGHPLLPLVQAIHEGWKDRLQGVVLFGSAARGEARQGSDIDLLLVLKTGLSLNRELYREWESQYQASHPEVSPQFVHLPAGPDDAGGIWFEVAIDGIVLWDEDSRVTRLLIRLREAIARRDVYRSLTHGHPYWVKTKGS